MDDSNSITTTASQQTLCIHNPQDVSNILFNNSTCKIRRIEPFVGPIRVVSSSFGEDVNNEQKLAVVHGRGVVATRNIQAGELLFATSPSIQANVDKVKELWKSRFNDDHSTERRGLLEACTEEVLVQAMLAEASNDVVASFMCLVGTSSSGTLDVPSLDVLNVQNGASIHHAGGKERSTPTTRDDLLRVIRHNAFGPDGLQSYDHVERIWRSECEQGGFGENDDYLPPRLLGIYPLAAMLNHSCVANAVRVYAGDIMLVHASSDIAQGQEIVWSYLPPTWSHDQRVQTLQNLHGFVCKCTRCVAEQEAYNNTSENLLASKLKTIDDVNRTFATSRSTSSSQNKQDNQKQLFSAIALLENDILRDTSLSNEMRRYLRVGYTQVYIRHLNTELACLSTMYNNTSSSSTAADDANKRREELLMLCMQLHFSFCACHHASTEHLSVCKIQV